MNAFDYFFENTLNNAKDFLLGPKETISHKSLYELSLKLANYLYDTIGISQNIILIAPNSLFFLIAYLGIIKSGNVVVPLNPEIEQNNLNFIQEKCQAGMVIANAKLASKLNFSGLKHINETVLDKIIQETSVTELSKAIDPNHLAEIIFTSGSTGEPKGVMVSHKNLIANTASIIEYLKLSDKDIMLVVLPLYYCYGLSLLHTHLRVGGSIVFNNMFMMLGGVINDLKQFNCTGFAGVPTHFQILLRKSDSFKTSQFPSLRYVTQAGGKLHNAFIAEFIETFPEIRFNVMYGQTEATARLSWLPPEKLPEKIGSCGKAIPGVQLIVADEKGHPVNPGETGEILASGDNIMLGYYKDQESTAKTIYNGWLRTGDLATVDEDGYIYLSARKKEIFKVGGRRVSPKEIEEVIVSMPEVVDCTIEGLFDEILGETMKATIVVKENAGFVTPDTVKSWCNARLASFKIPQIIEIRDKMAISATGKKIRNKS